MLVNFGNVGAGSSRPSNSIWRGVMADPHLAKILWEVIKCIMNKFHRSAFKTQE